MQINFRTCILYGGQQMFGVTVLEVSGLVTTAVFPINLVCSM